MLLFCAVFVPTKTKLATKLEWAHKTNSINANLTGRRPIYFPFQLPAAAAAAADSAQTNKTKQSTSDKGKQETCKEHMMLFYTYLYDRRTHKKGGLHTSDANMELIGKTLVRVSCQWALFFSLSESNFSRIGADHSRAVCQLSMFDTQQLESLTWLSSL